MGRRLNLRQHVICPAPDREHRLKIEELADRGVYVVRTFQWGHVTGGGDLAIVAAGNRRGQSTHLRGGRYRVVLAANDQRRHADVRQLAGGELAASTGSVAELRQPSGLVHLVTPIRVVGTS